MNELSKVLLRSSEVRERLNELGQVEAPEEGQVEEMNTLTAEYKTLETRHRALLVGDAGEGKVDPEERDVGKVPDREERERLELRGKARVGDFVAAALTGRPIRGASGEYAEAVGTPGAMPLDLLDVPEERAVTPGPADETVTATRPTVPHAFARTDAAALGVSMPMVAAGEAHFPALTTAPPAGREG